MNFSEILSLFQQGKGTARSHMKNLIEMAAVDGNFDPVEYELLKSIAKHHGISESQLKSIRENPEGVKFVVPPDKKLKFDQMYDLVHMMTIDNAIQGEEKELCKLFAIKFGYKKEYINELIETIRLNIENGQDHEEAMKRAKMLIS